MGAGQKIAKSTPCNVKPTRLTALVVRRVTGTRSKNAPSSRFLISSALATARDRHTEQKCDRQACKGSFAGDRADRSEGLSRLPGGCDDFAQPIDRGLKCGGDLGDGARNIGRGINGAFRHAGLEGRLKWFAHVQCPSCCAADLRHEKMKPLPLAIRAPILKALWLSTTGAVLNGGWRPLRRKCAAWRFVPRIQRVCRGTFVSAAV